MISDVLYISSLPPRLLCSQIWTTRRMRLALLEFRKPSPPRFPTHEIVSSSASARFFSDLPRTVVSFQNRSLSEEKQISLAGSGTHLTVNLTCDPRFTLSVHELPGPKTRKELVQERQDANLCADLEADRKEPHAPHRSVRTPDYFAVFPLKKLEHLIVKMQPRGSPPNLCYCIFSSPEV